MNTEMKKGWLQTVVRSQPFEFIFFADQWRATVVVTMPWSAIRRGWEPIPEVLSPNEVLKLRRVIHQDLRA